MATTPTEEGAATTPTNATPFATLNSQNRSGTSEGGYDYELCGVQDSRFECPICLLCLRDPVLTTCGHKFCSGCIQHWVVNLGGKCPVDAVSLSPENIFPDNFTRREIMQSKAKCPCVGCEIVLSINELERHVAAEHKNPSPPGKGGVVGAQNGGYVDVVECSFKEFGCDIRAPRSEFQAHLENSVHHHLHLMTIAYKRLKMYSSRSNLDNEPFRRQDSRDSARWLHLGADSEGLLALDSDPDYEFRRQRSWDSVRFAQNKKGGFLPTKRLFGSRVAESDESLCSKPHPSSAPPHGHSHAHNQGEPQLNDIFERLVRLEQEDREKGIKIERLQADLTHAVKLLSYASHFINKFGAYQAHGVFVWSIKDFRKLCGDMRKDPNRVKHSQGFYTDSFGYKMCLRFNLTTPSSHGAAAVGGDVQQVPLEQDKDTFISLYVHLMQGDFDSSLGWPFVGELSLLLIHPSSGDKCILETIISKTGATAYGRPALPRNPTGIGFREFCPIDKAFSEGYVKDDTLTCKIIARAQHHYESKE